MKKLILSTLLLIIISLGYNSAQAQEPGVVAESTDGTAVEAKTENGISVRAVSKNTTAIFVTSANGTAIFAESNSQQPDNHTIIAFAHNYGHGVKGQAKNGHGVLGESQSPNFSGGVFTNTAGPGIYVKGGGSNPLAGFFEGRLQVTGIVAAQNISQSSDRNLKSNFVSLSGRDVLKKLMTVPVQKWNYKNESTSVLHIGPMAQDFHKAFGVGYDDKTISTVDANGVALAAIQGLYEMIQERDVQLEKQSQQIAELTKQVEALNKKEPTKTQKVRKSHR